MKSIFLILIIACFLGMSACHEDHVYNWSVHKDGNELYTSLKDEPQDIFVICIFKDVEGDDKLKKQNADLQDKITREIMPNHDNTTFTKIDLTKPEDEEKYKDLLDNVMQLKKEVRDAKLPKGPIVAVVNNGEGSWIHGKGTEKEIIESIDIFIHEAEDRKKGGTGYVYGSDQARKEGGITSGFSY